RCEKPARYPPLFFIAAAPLSRTTGLANAPPPLLFERRGERLHFRPPRNNPRGWSAERRNISRRLAAPRPDCRAPASQRSIAAILRGPLEHRTDLGPRLPPGANRAPVAQQAPCTRIVVSVGRGPEASRERGYEPRPQAPHPAPSSKRP